MSGVLGEWTGKEESWLRHCHSQEQHKVVLVVIGYSGESLRQSLQELNRVHQSQTKNLERKEYWDGLPVID